MIRAAIAGATGYAGAELVRILLGHPNITITALTSRQFSGTAFGKVFPAFSGVMDMPCEELTDEGLSEKADVIFLALPHKLPMEIVPALIKQGKKVVDLSADFRFQNVSAYEAHYQPHTAKDVLKQAVYGLSEVYAEQIKAASIIGNPGCYPTSVLLPLIPLLKKNLLDTTTIIADSKSGVSGAGRSASLTVHYCEVTESFKAYKVAAHRHNPEMDEFLSKEAGHEVHITFVPHLIPMSRGMLTTTYASLSKTASDKDIRECIAEFYRGRPFVRLCPEGSVPNTIHVRGTNFCDIGVKVDKKANRLVLISAIDNLVKGASGQAVQNMNIMLGLDETTGLKTAPSAL